MRLYNKKGKKKLATRYVYIWYMIVQDREKVESNKKAIIIIAGDEGRVGF